MGTSVCLSTAVVILLASIIFNMLKVIVLGALAASFTIAQAQLCPDNDVDYKGGDLKLNLDVPSWRECAQGCRKEAECTAFTYVQKTKCCYLKKGDAKSNKVAAPGLISGDNTCGDYSKLSAIWDVKWTSGSTSKYRINKNGTFTAISCSWNCKDISSAQIQESDTSLLPSPTWFLVKPIHRQDAWMYFRFDGKKLKVYWFKKTGRYSFNGVPNYYGTGGEGTGVKALIKN